jgi:hypothetical protein
MAAAGRAGMAANGQHLGVTEPISIAGPTEMDCIKTRELEKVKRQGSTTGLGFFLLVVWFAFYAACEKIRTLSRSSGCMLVLYLALVCSTMGVALGSF